MLGGTRSASRTSGVVVLTVGCLAAAVRRPTLLYSNASSSKRTFQLKNFKTQSITDRQTHRQTDATNNITTSHWQVIMKSSLMPRSLCTLQRETNIVTLTAPPCTTTGILCLLNNDHTVTDRTVDEP